MKNSESPYHVEDAFFLRLIRERNKQAFRHLFDLYFIALCRFARIYVKEEQIAEEIALDVFTWVWEKRESIEITLTWKAYLTQATRNKALNYLRNNQRFILVSDWTFYERTEEDQSLELKELEKLIQEAIYSLPARCQEIFLKSRRDYLSNKEIAAELQVSVKNVEAQITKALRLIRHHLKDGYTYLW